MYCESVFLNLLSLVASYEEDEGLSLFLKKGGSGDLDVQFFPQQTLTVGVLLRRSSLYFGHSRLLLIEKAVGMEE